jgi:hypothetical protein
MTTGKGQTVIRGEVRLGNLAGAICGGVGLGGFMAPGALFFLSPIAGVVGVAGWLGGAVWACRKLLQRSSAKRKKRLEDVLDRLEKIVEAEVKSAE